MGFGGSVFMWHPELKLSFAYVPSRMAWYDFTNKRSGEIMDVLSKCVKELKESKDH